MFEKFKEITLNILFPISCLSCKKDDEWICDECLNKIPLKKEQVCPICQKKITPDGRVCFSCNKKFQIDGVFIASNYNNNLISRSVHYYKYRFIQDLSTPLGKILRKAILSSGLSVPDIIIPVPLHKKRLRWRGFNQAELLANYLSQNLTLGFEIPIASDIILRKKYTPPQMKIKNICQRKENIQNAFAINVNKKFSIKNKRILLVDDIAATGATLFECAKTLKKSGAKEVFGIVIAR